MNLKMALKTLGLTETYTKTFSTILDENKRLDRRLARLVILRECHIGYLKIYRDILREANSYKDQLMALYEQLEELDGELECSKAMKKRENVCIQMGYTYRCIQVLKERAKLPADFEQKLEALTVIGNFIEELDGTLKRTQNETPQK